MTTVDSPAPGARVEIATMDGTMPAYRAEPPAGAPSRAALLLLHEGFGLNDHIASVADRLAVRGHRVLAPNLYYRTTDEAAAYEDVPRALELVASLTVDDIAADIAAAASYLSPADSSVRALGFCFGGAAAYIATARVPSIERAVAFYPVSILSYWDEAGMPERPLLAIFGDEDEFLGETEVRWLESLDRDPASPIRIQILSGAGHAFFNDARPELHRAEPAARAWQDALNFLDANDSNHCEGAGS